MQLFRKSKPHKIVLEKRAIEFEDKAGCTLLETALANGVEMPYDCKVGSCGTCRFRLIEGKTRELNSSALALDKEQLDAGYRLACQTLPKTDLVIGIDYFARSSQDPAKTYDGQISRYEYLSHDIIGLRVKLDGSITFTAGQYAKLSLPLQNLTRNYSFASAPGDGSPTEVEFHIRLVPGGAFTEWLFADSRLQQTIQLSGPYGDFYLREDDSPILCIAGGSGLAPIASLLQQAHWQGCTRSVTVLYGARQQRDLYFQSQINSLAEKWTGDFFYLPVLSEETADSPWQGARGMVTDHLEKISDLTSHQAYICGPPPMVDAAEATLVRSGVSSTQIFADRFLDLSHQKTLPNQLGD